MGFLEGDGAMAEAIRDFRWHETALGPVQEWPVVLKTTASLILNSHFPQCIIWGPELIAIPNDAFLPILGDKPVALGRSFADIWSEVWDDIAPIARSALNGEATYIENHPLVIDRSSEREEAHFTFCYSPIRDENGKVKGFLDTVTETTDRVRADRQTRTLNHELGHRLKNVLAVTQAIVSQTMRHAPDMQTARTSVGQRLAALGRAADILTASAWDSADLRELARTALAPHRQHRITINGPSVHLPSQQAIALALALHELATNASKYGALSTDRGSIDLGWQIAGADGPEGRLCFTWSERGGPRIQQPPARKGFGSSLIERVLQSSFKGNVVLDYRPEGLLFTLDAPSAQLAVFSEDG